MSSGKKVGRALIKVNGKLLETYPGAKLDIGGVERTPIPLDSGDVAFSGATKPAMLECEMAVGVGTSMKEIGNIEDATVTFECDTGQVYIMANAFVTDTMQLTAGDGGKCAVKMSSKPCEEML